MRIFVTGGAGYVGQPITELLNRKGHDVIAMSRTDQAGRTLKRLGASTLTGDLRNLDSFIEEAVQCEVFIHLAQHRSAERYEIDSRLFDALARRDGRASRLRHFIYTSTLFVLGEVADGPMHEHSEPRPPVFAAPRLGVEQRVLNVQNSRLITTVIRPGMVYGGGEGGTVSELFRSAAEEGAARYVGSGENRWTLIHRKDVARLFLAAVERRTTGIVHAVDGVPMQVREVARLASSAAGREGTTEAVGLAEARRELGSFADALGLDEPAVTIRADELGWSPAWPPFSESAPAAFEEWRQRDRTDGGN